MQIEKAWRASASLFLVVFSICCSSFLLLVYVGFGEVQRTYPNFIIGKLIAQGEIIRAPFESHLRAGLPIEQFPGFRQIGERIRASDPSLHAIVVSDMAGRVTFSVGDENAPPLLNAATKDEPFAITQRNEDWLQVFLPLHDRFSVVGAVGVTVRQAEINDALWRKFGLFVPISVALAFAAALSTVLMSRRGHSVRWSEAIFVAGFIAVAVLVFGALVSIYSEGAQAKARALSDSLDQRIEPVFAYGLSLDDFEGLTQLFEQYSKVDPSIRSISLVQDNTIRLDLDPGRVGKPWMRDPGTFEFSSAIGGGENLSISVTLPSDVVYAAVGDSAKDFFALLLGVGLLSAVFRKLLHGLAHPGRVAAPTQSAEIFDQLTPVFFVSVFAESLSAGFLPQFLTRAAQAAGYPASTASLAFSVYFFAFLATVLPGQQLTDKFGERGMIIFGALLASCSALLLAAPVSFETLIVARALCGVGQALLLVGAQSYILTHAPANQRTRGAAVIVFGFNGGMIAGASIGSLLVNSIGAQGVFMTTSCVLAANAILAFALFPSSLPTGAAPALSEALAVVGRSLRDAARSPGFWRVLLFVGAPSKAVLTGIIGFLMPLTLAQLAYAPEDIGQLIMLYPVGVLIATPWAARAVDRGVSSDKILLIGMSVSGFAMLLVGAAALIKTSFSSQALGDTIAIAAGLVLLGLGHGFINAPVITHVAHLDVAERLGAPQAASLYRLLERLGHACGPAIAGHLFLLTGFGLGAISAAGAATLALGLLFAAISPIMRTRV